MGLPDNALQVVVDGMLARYHEAAGSDRSAAVSAAKYEAGIERLWGAMATRDTGDRWVRGGDLGASEPSDIEVALSSIGTF